MLKRPITPGPAPFERILTGDVRMGSDFRTNRPRGTADWLIIHTTGGEGILLGDGKRHRLRPGSVVLSRPETAHHYRTSPGTGRWDLLWAHFHPREEWLDWLRWPKLVEGWGMLTFQGKTERNIRRRLREMHHHASHPQGLGRHDLLAMNALEEVLLWCDVANESPHRPMDGPTRIVLDTISSQYAAPLTLKTLAQKSGQSVARLTRYFRIHVGLSPQIVIEKHRLDRARQLLARTTLSIKEIAAQTGFASPFYFSLRFKAASGSSPRDYRRRAEAGRKAHSAST